MARVTYDAHGTAWPRVQVSWVSVLAYSTDVKNIDERQIRKKVFNVFKEKKVIVPVAPWLYHDTALQSFSLQIMHL